MLCMRDIKQALFLTVILSDFGEPLNILGLFQHPRYSHFQFFQAITRGLAFAGHNLTVISHFPQEPPIPGYRDLPLNGMNTQMNGIDIQNMTTVSFYDHFLEFMLLYDFAEDACNLTVNSPALQQVLNENSHYDVVLMEQFNTDCLMGVAYILQAPVVALISSPMMPWLYERFGSPFLPSFMPTLYAAHADDMNFYQRLKNWFNFHMLRQLYKFYSIPSADATIRSKFGSDIPSVAELAKNTSLILVNTHFSLSGAKPHSPTIIEVGGVHIQSPTPLPATLKDWLDNAKEGVILISWGSMIRAATLPDEKRNALLQAVKRLRQHVIWKWENETMSNKPDNVLISEWLPQRDVLCHPNVRAFMTHGGLLGVSEAVYCGVPCVVTPINGDQFLNAAALNHRGMGVVLQYDEMQEDIIFNALQTVLTERYMHRAKIISNSFRIRPMPPLQTAIWWIEYVGNTGGAALLKSSANNMSALVYHSWDIYIFLMLTIGVFLSGFCYLTHRIRVCIQRKSKVKLN